MLSTRRKIAATITALAAATAGIATAQPSTAQSPAPKVSLSQAAISASITFLPGIADPGKKVSKADRAKGVVAVQVTPGTSGSVTLQKFDGANWATVKTVKIKKALARFNVPVGDAATYKAVVTDGTGATLAETTQVSSSQWGLPDFSDEFTGRRLSSNWSTRGTGYNKVGFRACSRGSKKATKVGDGVVKLSVLIDKKKAGKKCVAKRANGKVIGKFDYRLNGHISTSGKASFTYGVLAARVKFQKLQGQHASVWMQPEHPLSDNDPATGGAEVDVIEWFGDNVPGGGLTSFIYTPVGGGERKKVGGWIKEPNRFLANKKDDWFKGYHVFSVEWTPQAYIFRIDGQETYRTSAGISGIPEYPILSLLSSDYELPKINKKNLPQTMNVDWVRFWDTDPTA